MVTVKISPQFSEDLDEICNFIGKDSQFYAKEFVKKVFSMIDLIKKFPNLGRIVPEKQNSKIRELIYRTYRIIYQVKPNEIEFVTIIQGSSQLKI